MSFGTFKSGCHTIVRAVLKHIDATFDVEREINGRSMNERLAVRHARVAPLVSELETWMRKERQAVAPQ